jgi:glycosyltransferase involved in cell wall biosynthesis
MRKVLIIAYYFPPFGGGGVQRTVKFVKYLPEFGWLPVVLTVERQFVHLCDIAMEREIPPQVSVYRTSTVLLPQWLPWCLRKLIGQWLLVVDQQLGWLPFAVHQGMKVIHQEDVQCLYTTSAPYTDHLIGYWLKRRTGLPWVADFRDPWVGNVGNLFPSRFHERIAKWIEGQIALSADQVIMVSEPLRQALLARHPMLNPDRVVAITNGYDLADFVGTTPFRQETGRFTIAYTGSFYGPQMPLHFLKGLRLALDNGGIPRERLQVCFVGRKNKVVQTQIESLDLDDVIQLHGYLPHKQAISHLLGADILLLVIGSGADNEMVFGGKVFEYVATGRPVLALVPPKGVAASLVRDAQAGVVVEPEDAQQIADQIAILYERWQRGELESANNQEVIARYDRRRLTAILAEILDDCFLARGNCGETLE